MLAQDYTKLRKPITFPVDAQSKLNGVRCWARKINGETVLLSRSGKVYDIEHIRIAATPYLNDTNVLDGEVYVHGMPLQDINKLVKKHRPGKKGSILLDFVVYDVFSLDSMDDTWIKRKLSMQDLLPKTGKVRYLSTTYIATETALKVQHKIEEDLGFEGIIIRTHKGKYILGHRSKDLLKLKNFKDDEFEIIGYKEGTGKYKGCVTWICRVKGTTIVDVTPKGTIAQKREWFNDAEQYVGKQLTVQYQELSVAGVPIFPVGLTIREDL